MKLSYSVDPRGRLALLTLRPSASPDAWTSGLTAFTSDREVGSDFRVFVDCRRVPPVDRNFAIRLIGWLRDHRGKFAGSRWALLTSGGSAYGAARELSIRAESYGLPVQAFTDMRVALGWLRDGHARFEAAS